MSGSDETPKLSVWWPLQYALAAIRMHRFVLAATLALSILQQYVQQTSGNGNETPLLWLVQVLLVSVLSTAAIRLAATDAGETVESRVTRSALLRMTALSVAASMFLVLLQLGVMLTYMGSIRLSAQEFTDSERQKHYKSVLQIEPAVVAKHSLSKGSIVQPGDISIRDVDVLGTWLGDRELYVVHDPRNVIGHQLLQPIVEGKVINPSAVGLHTQQGSADAIPPAFDASIEHERFVDPKTKLPMAYGAYAISVSASRPIRKGEVFSAANVSPRYVRVEVGPDDFPKTHSRYVRSLDWTMGYTASKDLAQGTEIDDGEVGPFCEDNRLAPVLTPYGFYLVRLSIIIPFLKQAFLPIAGAFAFCLVWFYIYTRSCLASVPVVLHETGLRAAIKESWGKTRGNFAPTARYLAKFGAVYWLVPVFASAVAILVQFTHYELPQGNWVAMALSFFAWILIVVSSIAFSVIMVPLYSKAASNSSDTSREPKVGSRPPLRKTKVLGCGINHERAMLNDESTATEEESSEAAPADAGVVIDVRRALHEKDQLP